MADKYCSVCGVKLRIDNNRGLCKEHRKPQKSRPLPPAGVGPDLVMTNIAVPGSGEQASEPVVTIRLRESKIVRLLDLLLQ